MPDAPPPGERGFTLVEILSAISVILVLMAFAAPAVTSLARGRNLTYASTVISNCLDQARMTAVAQKNYVWVGFAALPAANPDRLMIAAFISKDGTRTLNSSNVRPLDRIAVLEQVVAMNNLGNLIERPTLPQGASAYQLPITSGDLLSWQIPGGQAANFACVLEFAPDGSVKANKQLRRLAEFGIAQVTDTAKVNPVAFQVEGLSGRSHVYRR